ncbi:MAG: type III secretion system chaperone [Kiritimatiellae bacterium]|nr:type III secretion system chaperone [Kiritimatiellia bacterium]
MEFTELISDFASRHGVEGLAAEDGAAALDVDGVAILLAAAGDALVASAEIGEPPPDGAATFADLLLEANLESEDFFAKSKENGKYLLVRRVPLAGLGGDAFDSALEALVNRAEAWRKLLADYRHAAAAAAEAAAADATAVGTGGFMQV